jgi:hypothetical protein
MEWITDPQVWIAFITLVALELVLGIDNVVFISILAGKLPGDQPKKARLVGLSLAKPGDADAHWIAVLTIVDHRSQRSTPGDLWSRAVRSRPDPHRRGAISHRQEHA